MQLYNPVRYVTYAFTYNNDPIPHLTQLRNYIQSGEAYDFTYLSGQLVSPFSPPVSFGQTALLQRATIYGLNLSHQFEYATGAGELTRITLPYGAVLSYQSREFTHLGSRTLREVQYRQLKAAPGAAAQTWLLVRDDASDAGRTFHQWAQLYDPTGVSKVWWFYLDGPAWRRGLLRAVEDRTAQNSPGKRVDVVEWSQDAAGNPYISMVLTTLDPGAAYQKQMKTEQVMDSHGNVTQLRVYDWGNLSTPARTYSYTYLTDANYTSRRIYNRLVSAQVSGGGQTLTLAYNTYDRTYLTERTNLRNHDTANYGPYFRWRGNLISTIGGPRPLYFWHDITGTPTVISEWADGRDPLTVTVSPQTNYAAPSALSAGTSPPTRKATVNGRWERTTYDGPGRPIKTGLGAGARSTRSWSGMTRPARARPWGESGGDGTRLDAGAGCDDERAM